MGGKLNKKILWIEDDYRDLKGLLKPIERRGFEVVSARCYEQAIAELAKLENDFCLIVLDLIIPRSLTKIIPPKISEEEYENGSETPDLLVENGMELLKYIKQELKLPVIILSIISNNDIIHKIEELNVKRIAKIGLLPNKLEEFILNELRDN